MADVTIRLDARLFGNVVNNVTVWSNGPETQEDRESFVDAFRLDFIAAGVLNDLVTDWQLDGLTFIYNETVPSFSVTVPFPGGPLVGDGTGDTVATQTALLVSTQYVGPPPNRGRIYFAGLEKDNLGSSGFWAAAVVDQFQELVTGWSQGLSYAGGSNVAFLRIARRNPDGSLDITNPVEEAIGRRNPTTQRRRRIGQGI